MCSERNTEQPVKRYEKQVKTPVQENYSTLKHNTFY